MAYTYLVGTGVIIADTQDILSDVENEWIAAFGSAIDLDASTPQGTIVAAEATARAAVMRNNAELANQMNPNEAYGVFLDATASLLGVERGKNQSTIGSGLRITGTAGLTIPDGSRVSTPVGDIFATVGDVTIPNGSTQTDVAVVASQAYGVVDLPVGNLTIIDGLVGWGSIQVLDTTTVTPGSTSVNDPKLKNLRNQRLAAQGVGSSAAILAAILAVNNVTSCQVVENNTGAPGVINGVTFTKGNAMWFCVAGTPDLNQVAAAAYAAHQGGCPWDYGSASGVPIGPPNGLVVTDATTNQQYGVLGTTPVLYDVYAHVIASQNQAVTDLGPSIRQAIIDYATGQMAGEDGLVVGASISSWEFGGAISRALPGIYTKECKIAVVPKGAAAPVYPSDYVYEYDLKPFEQGVVDFGRIIVVSP